MEKQDRRSKAERRMEKQDDKSKDKRKKKAKSRMEKAKHRIRKKYAAFDRAAKNVRGMRMYGGSYKGRSMRFTSDLNKARVFKDSKTENLKTALEALQFKDREIENLKRENKALKRVKRALKEARPYSLETLAGFPILDEERMRKEDRMKSAESKPPPNVSALSSTTRPLPVLLTPPPSPPTSPPTSPEQDSPESKSRSYSDPFKTPGRLFNLLDSPYNLYK